MKSHISRTRKWRTEIHRSQESLTHKRHICGQMRKNASSRPRYKRSNSTTIHSSFCKQRNDFFFVVGSVQVPSAFRSKCSGPLPCLPSYLAIKPSSSFRPARRFSSPKSLLHERFLPVLRQFTWTSATAQRVRRSSEHL